MGTMEEVMESSSIFHAVGIANTLAAPSKPLTIREELQKEADEWLKDE